MATSKDFATYVEDALRHIAKTRIRAMFGEYAIYCDDMVVGSICDDIVFIKITPGTRALFGPEAQVAPPYPGAKPNYVVPEAMLEDRELIKSAISVCRKDLGAKKPATKPATQLAKVSPGKPVSRRAR